MKTAKSNRDEIRKNTLSIPMTKIEKEAVRETAEKYGLTMTSWARMVLKDKTEQK